MWRQFIGQFFLDTLEHLAAFFQGQAAELLQNLCRAHGRNLPRPNRQARGFSFRNPCSTLRAPMILGAILKQIRQIERRANRLVNDHAAGARASARFNVRTLAGSRMNPAPNSIPTLKRRERRAPQAHARIPTGFRLDGNAAAASSSTGGASAGSPRREPWDHAPRISPAPSGATDSSPRCSFAPVGVDAVGPLTHGSRRGLPPAAAPQLSDFVSCVIHPRSNSVGRDSKPLEFEGFGSCGEFATIRNRASIRMNCGSNPIEFDGIKNSTKRHFTWSIA